ncbi:MAG: spore coat associated protein CotJA [Firmicutes bacterium]|nr:spore coat associated protein CotJA [Bacillota bacterium]
MHLGSLPIAMAYVPIQQWRNVYSLKDGLERGTIFPELDLPFEGKGGHKR